MVTCPQYLTVNAPLSANPGCSHPAASTFCPLAWQKHEDCLLDTSYLLGSCEAFLDYMETELRCSAKELSASKAPKLKDLGSFKGKKTLIFWSGASDQAEALAPKINAFVLNLHTPFANLMREIPTFSKDQLVAEKGYVRTPECQDSFGYGYSLNTWTAASRRFASYLRDGDTALVLQAAWRQQSVFAQAELPQIVDRLARPVHEFGGGNNNRSARSAAAADPPAPVAPLPAAPAPVAAAPASVVGGNAAKPNVAASDKAPALIIRIGGSNGQKKFKCNEVEMATSKSAAECVALASCDIIQKKLVDVTKDRSTGGGVSGVRVMQDHAIAYTVEADCDDAYETCPRALKLTITNKSICPQLVEEASRTNPAAPALPPPGQ